MQKKNVEVDRTVNQIKKWHIPKLRVTKVISSILPLKLKLYIEKSYLFFMNKVKFRKEHIKYSKRWYEEVYHSTDIYYLPQRDYYEVMKQSEEAGEIKQLLETFASINLPEDEKMSWLEVACHHGKTPFVLAEKYKNTHFYMFDFSKVAVEWCNKYNPFPDRTTIWQGDIRNIEFDEMRFNGYFDVITCMDVTEHLPYKIYIKAIKEISRVCKVGGLLVLRQGNVPLREHINILDENKLVKDFEKTGFRKIDELPHRCHVLKRE
ncbi:MAG: class I SAM-dependent methyltransferase [Candidatus Scalindua sp.]